MIKQTKLLIITLENDKIIGKCKYEDKGLIPKPIPDKGLYFQIFKFQIINIMISRALFRRMKQFPIIKIYPLKNLYRNLLI